MRVVYSFMRFFFILVCCSLFVAACGDDDYSKGGLDFTVPSDDGGDEIDLSVPDLSAVDNTDGGPDSATL